MIRFVKHTVKDMESHLLDYGCGAGRNAIALAKEGYKVIAMDYNHEAVEVVKKRALQEQLEIKCLVNAGNEIPLDYNSIDLVLADGSLFFKFARHGRALTGESPEHAQIVGSV